MFVAILEVSSRVGEFRGYGETEGEAIGTVRVAWAQWREYSGAQLDWEKDLRSEVQTLEVKPGECYRDEVLAVSTRFP